MNKIIIFVLLSIYICDSRAVTELNLEENVHNSELIFIGNIIKYYEQMETIKVSEKNKMVSKKIVYTTFGFTIENILKGEFSQDVVEVRQKGGCDEDLDICSDSSEEGYYYDYEEPIGKVLLFLKKDKLNNFYYSTDDYKTAFLVHGSIEVITYSNNALIFALIKGKERDIITLNDVKDILGDNNE